MRKKVLHIISSTSWRGAEQQVDYMFNSHSAEFEIYLFCAENCALSKRNQDQKERIFTYKKRFGFDVFAALELKKVCTKNKIDLIHLHDSHAINTYVLADLFGMNIPAIIHRHVNFTISHKWKYQHKKIKKIICVSKEVKRNLVAFISEEKLIVVNPGIKMSQWSMVNGQWNNKIKNELNLSNETKLIGIVAALEKEKNIEEFIAIANKIIEKKNDVHFVIVGDGSLILNLKAQILNLKANIYFLGFRNDIPEILSGFDVFLFTSKNEGFGQVLLEAMASKVPIVSSNFSTVKEIIENGKTGFIYKDIEEAISNIGCLIADVELRNIITKNAFSFVQQFDLSLMNKKIEEVYSSLNIEY